MFTIICDGCGKDVNADSDISAWNDEGYLENIRNDADWVKVDEKHYCTNCYEYDQNDNMLIKTNST